MFSQMFRGRGVWFSAFLLVIFLSSAVAAGAQSSQPASTSTTEAALADVPVLDERFTKLPEEVSLPPIPPEISSDPEQALIDAVNAHSASLGFPVNHEDAIRDAGLSDEFAARAALLMQAVLDCPPVDNLTEVTEEQVECAAATQDASAGVSQVKDENPPGDVQAWPSLYIDGDGSDDYYVHDYTVLIDRGGNDTYDNNAGANLMDIQHAPEGSAAGSALSNEPAVGCEHAQTLPPVPPSAPPPQDCIADRQTVLLDQASDDVYGVFKPPRQEDHNPLPVKRTVDGDCTGDPVIRRVVLQGAGFQGNGQLTDEGGNDKYRAKTASQGAGHIGGTGVLRDLGGGDDEYLAIRSSQGFALVAGPNGFGLLQEDGGNDLYHTYMPRPLDPNRWINEHGAGGVVDDFDNCDPIPRMMQGTAIGFGEQGGSGILLDEDGKDTYIGAPLVDQMFSPPIEFRQSSQGFGCDGGVGILEDRGSDKDKYRKGPKNRRNGVTIFDTQVECGFFPAPGQGIFKDDGPGKKKG